MPQALDKCCFAGLMSWLTITQLNVVFWLGTMGIELHTQQHSPMGRSSILSKAINHPSRIQYCDRLNETGGILHRIEGTARSSSVTKNDCVDGGECGKGRTTGCKTNEKGTK